MGIETTYSVSTSLRPTCEAGSIQLHIRSSSACGRTVGRWCPMIGPYSRTLLKTVANGCHHTTPRRLKGSVSELD